MPTDVNAVVISNLHLSDDYNVRTLAAPAIGEGTAPGQFVMVKAGAMIDSILRRPFSVFEVLRDRQRVTGISILNKRAGVGTALLYEVRPGDRRPRGQSLDHRHRPGPHRPPGDGAHGRGAGRPAGTLVDL